jgi:signal transduction histidine kinase
VYLQQNKLDLALRDLFKVIEITDGSIEYFHTSNSFNDIAYLYQTIDQLDSTILYATKGLDAARQNSYMQGILAASKILAEVYQSNDPVKALYYYKQAQEAGNKLYGAGNIQIIRDLISKDQQRRKELADAEIAFANRMRSILFLIGTLVLLLISLILYRGRRRSEAAQKVLEQTLGDLKSTQSQLIQSEKMASLGELTAGIAHEIQNPLNFVNNFSEVNSELFDELKAERSKGKGERDETLVEELISDLVQNTEKIHHHGQRASGIVKGMLEHSRTSDGKKELTDINALADEYLRLAYHGLRAKDNAFNADFKTEFDESLPKINVIPQEIGRVLLNLINNAFYVVSSKASQPMPKASDGEEASEDKDYKPLVIVSTKKLNDKIEISVKDNGPGIPNEIKDKIFQPFLTTKPTGQGTGLGLSLSYDIVKAHGGELKLDTKEGQGSTFNISIPIN